MEVPIEIMLTGKIAALIERAIANPKTTLAGISAIAAALWPHHAMTIAAVVTGLGLIFAQDSK